VLANGARGKKQRSKGGGNDGREYCEDKSDSFHSDSTTAHLRKRMHQMIDPLEMKRKEQDASEFISAELLRQMRCGCPTSVSEQIKTITPLCVQSLTLTLNDLDRPIEKEIPSAVACRAFSHAPWPY
jgi:hypothetical protein